MTFPGFANTHSHAFHRALRGRVQANSRSFWEWRSMMYQLADNLDPDSYRSLATAVFAEMALSGFTLVGEFHYLHHQSGGNPYRDPNAMGKAIIEAAREAGVRLTLLDACYLQGGIDRPLETTQERFADASAEAWIERTGSLSDDSTIRIGSAIHSVRAVPRQDLSKVAAAAAGRPLHIHLSEQIVENEQTLAAYGFSPTTLLATEGVLAEGLTAIHATHLEPGDIERLRESGTAVCACPTTEADLGDGIGPFAALDQAQVPLSIGTDQHVQVDPFLEVQRLELDQRLATSKRSIFAIDRLVEFGTTGGYRSLGWETGGRIAMGSPCDLTNVRLGSPRLSGIPPDSLPLSLAAADVDTVVVAGNVIVSDGDHQLVPEVASLMKSEIERLFP
jgi:formiminoglutamate deiminase